MKKFTCISLSSEGQYMLPSSQRKIKSEMLKFRGMRDSERFLKQFGPDVFDGDGASKMSGMSPDLPLST